MQNLLFVHHDALFVALRAPFLEQGFQFFLGLLFLVAHLGRALEILVLDGLFLLALDLLDLGFHGLDLRRARHRGDARARTGLVQHVNRLVRQKPVGDVTVGKLHGGLDGRYR